MNTLRRTSSLGLAGAMALAGMLTLASPAAAFNLRSPQVSFASFGLQGYLNVIGESINVVNSQLDAQSFQSSVSGNTTFTLMVELTSSFASSNNIGVYNALDPSTTPALCQIFPGAATAGWFATCHFTASGLLTVYLFDNSPVPVLQGVTSYSGVDRTHFGFYLDGPAGLYYSQDYRNAGHPQMLTYAGTGANYGDWWECFEDQNYSVTYSDFNDAVLLLQSVAPTPTINKSWGALKANYR
jgi:hypothetical protein